MTAGLIGCAIRASGVRRGEPASEYRSRTASRPRKGRLRGHPENFAEPCNYRPRRRRLAPNATRCHGAAVAHMPLDLRGTGFQPSSSGVCCECDSVRLNVAITLFRRHTDSYR